MDTSLSDEDTPRQFGIMKPISIAGPEDIDLQQDNELWEYMILSGICNNDAETQRRENVLARTDAIVKEWVKQLSTDRGYTDQILQNENAVICTFGSYWLGVDDPESNLDVLCIGPYYVNREEDFFILLHDTLKEMEQVTDLATFPDAFIPVMRFKLEGIPVDLLYVSVFSETVPEDLDVTKASALYDVDEPGARSIHCCRLARRILQLVPNIDSFKTTLRCIRFWAKQRSIYANELGFLGGVSWAIMVAHVCQLHPNFVPGMLVSRFFRVFMEWRWPNPVFLCPIEDEDLVFPSWDPTKNPQDGKHHMPIITPTHPFVNTGYNVSATTLKIMVDQFRHANKICEKIDKGQAEWEVLFEPFPFFHSYENYLQLEVVAKDDDDLHVWQQYVWSEMKKLTNAIEEDTFGQLQCHPHAYSYVDDLKEDSNCTFFIGLKKEQGVILEKGHKFDIQGTVHEFVQATRTFVLWEPSMELKISRIGRKEVPYVYHEGVMRFYLSTCGHPDFELVFGEEEDNGEQSNPKDQNFEEKVEHYFQHLQL